MREWIDEIADYMKTELPTALKEKDEISLPLIHLSEEIYQAALETEMLMQATNELEVAFTTILGKMEHVNS